MTSPVQATKVPKPLSEEALQCLWKDLNETYFFRRLPSIRIVWSSRLTSTAGLFVSHNGPRSRYVPLKERHGHGREIRLSLPLHHRQAIREIRNTLAHEMIHQWQFDVKKNRPSHGQEFRRMMGIMNENGMAISVYHTFHLEVQALGKYRWECVQCGQFYIRQRKTLSPKRHLCGNCRGTLRAIDPRFKDETLWETKRPDSQPGGQPFGGVGATNQGTLPIQLSLEFP